MTKNTANFLNIDWEKELSKWIEQQKEKAKQEKLSNNFSFIFKYLFILLNFIRRLMTGSDVSEGHSEIERPVFMTE